MEIHLNALVVASLVATAVIAVEGSAVEYKVINNASGTAGGSRFDRDIGLDYTKQVLINASSFIWRTLRMSSNETTQKTSRVVLTVDPTDVAPCTAGGEIHLSAEYIADYEGDVKAEITGLLYHELTHVWLGRDRNWTAPNPLLEGVADYVRLKAGYACMDWAKPGEGERWDQSSDVTARFLNYVEGLKHGDDSFVDDLNSWMSHGLTDLTFVRLVGQTVYEAWKLYRGIPLV